MGVRDGDGQVGVAYSEILGGPLAVDLGRGTVDHDLVHGTAVGGEMGRLRCTAYRQPTPHIRVIR